MSSGRVNSWSGNSAALPRRRLVPHQAKPRTLIPVVIIGLGVLMSYLAQDWLAGASLFALWAVWQLLWQEGHPPVLPLALTFQWLQATCGIFYYAITGREVDAMYLGNYRLMTMLALGCVVALALGLTAGLKWSGRHFQEAGRKSSFAFTWKVLFVSYIVSTGLNAFLREIAWSVPGLTQGLLAIGYLRLAVLFLMFRRLVSPRLRLDWFFGLLGAEVLLGLTGYFAGFREPIAVAALALLESFDSRSVAHWMRIAALSVVAAALGVMWIGIRTTYRAEIDEQVTGSRSERLERVGALSSEWFSSHFDAMMVDVDRLVERIWVIYYPALAVSRVPDVLPYENGAIMLSAVTHVLTPRILFPDKGGLQSDSEMVRKYSGVFVAGPEQNTSIAFGYAAESYVDFGIPVMFLPSLVFGLIMGFLYRALFHFIRRRELSVGFACVFFWVSLYLFERSWVKTLGTTGTILIYLGGLVWLLDRQLSERMGRRRYLR